MTSAAIEQAPDPDSLASRAYDQPDYVDRFSIAVENGSYADVDEVVTAWFSRQPWWIRVVSTNALTKSRVLADLESGELRPGTSVGAWELVDRTDEEIMFGESMGFMEYRVSFRLTEEPTIEVSNAVRYLWTRTGPLYFKVVRPFHKRFIRMMLAILAHTG